MALARLRLILLASVIILAGCAALKPSAEKPPVIPGSIRAEAVVEMSRGLSLSGRATVFVKAPGSFRIEVRSPFGSLAALIVSDGKAVYTLSNGIEEYYLWDDSAAPVPLSPDGTASLLMGLGAAAPEGYEVTRDGRGRVKSVSGLREAGAFSVGLADYRRVEGAEIPFDIRIRSSGQEIRIRYASVIVNPELAPDLFEISPPGTETKEETN